MEFHRGNKLHLRADSGPSSRGSTENELNSIFRGSLFHNVSSELFFFFSFSFTDSLCIYYGFQICALMISVSMTVSVIFCFVYV